MIKLALNTLILMKIFTDLSINFEKGTHTILTGPNGSGKSTILGLISGLYIPQSGKVSISSNKVGYIGVTPPIIDGTIKDTFVWERFRSKR